MLIMITQSKSVLAILNLGQILLCKTVIALCSTSFTSQYKRCVHNTSTTVSHISGSILGSKSWLVLQKNPALEQSYSLQGYMLLLLKILLEDFWIFLRNFLWPLLRVKGWNTVSILCLSGWCKHFSNLTSIWQPRLWPGGRWSNIGSLLATLTGLQP